MRALFSKKRRRSRGVVTVYVVLSSLTLIPMVGMAIDFSVLYNVKARMQAAVDAATIAAGYTLQRTTNMNNPAQIAQISSTAQAFFNANFPANYWGATQNYYNVTTGTGANQVRTIQLRVGYSVPMLFLRVLGLRSTTVAAQATANVRFVTMMVVVDRSGSVNRAGNAPVVQSALTQFIANSTTSVFVDGRDVIGMGSFGTNWNLDLAPTATFRSGTPAISTAISNIPFGNNATNTVEGLHRAYQQLQTMNNSGALNVIVLLTDGRPSALTLTMNVQSSCSVKGNKTGAITANVGLTWPPLPPTTEGGLQDASSTIYAFGLFNPSYTGLGNVISGADMDWVANSSGCHYYADGGQSIAGENFYKDVPTFPTVDAYSNSTTGPIYQGEGQSSSDPRAIRYAAFNAADNMATTIRSDTAIRPVLFVIGLNEPASGGEPLDADWLARVANDPTYKDALGNSVFQTGQTAGVYYNVQASGLAAAFQDIASQILRLAQ
jgi:Flp pilus assembly protein TadG